MMDLVPLRARSGVLVDFRPLLEGFSCPAILLSPDYRILACNQAYETHYGRQVSPGTDRCFAVSHGYDSPCDENGETCPLKAAQHSGRNERVFHIHHHPDGPEHVDVELRPLHDGEGKIAGYVELIRPVLEASAHAGGSFVGRSAAFQSMLELVTRVAPTLAPVLLLGESGTGKELAARAIHEKSERSDGPFVPVECSGLSEALFESELFGHVKGAFTGAYARKEGLVEAAAGGTLFLDEVGDIPLTLQVKLLRLLESSTYRRVGDTEPRHADFRLVCATHRDLEAMVSRGEFREDLYYRINTFPVAVPALRERRGDIPLLAESILRDQNKRLSKDAETQLSSHSFPGNIRELKNILDRAVILTDDEVIAATALPPNLSRPRPTPGGRGPDTPQEGARRPADAPPGSGQAAAESASSRSTGAAWPWGDTVLPLDEVGQRYLAWAAEAFEGERADLAKVLGLSERTLYRRLRGIRR